MAALVAVAHTFVQDRQDIFLPGALHNHQVLYEEAIFDVPSRLQNTRRWVQQVSELLIVDLEEACLDVKLLLAHGHGLPHVADRLGEEPVVLVSVRGPALSPNLFLVARHRVRLSRACLPVGENSGRIAIQGRVNQLVDTAAREHVALACALVQNCVEGELLAGIPWQGQD